MSVFHFHFKMASECQLMYCTEKKKVNSYRQDWTATRSTPTTHRLLLPCPDYLRHHSSVSVWPSLQYNCKVLQLYHTSLCTLVRPLISATIIPTMPPL